MSNHSRFSSRAVSRVAVRKTDEAAKRRRILLILSATSALVLCSIGLAQADTWVTVNPDGSVTRTEVSASQGNVRHMQDDAYVPAQKPSTRGYAGNTTIFSGTYIPQPPVYYGYPQSYYAPAPQGYTYPIAPVAPRAIPPMITVGPSVSNAPIYVVPGYGYYVPQPHYHYPYPVYTYPQYGLNGTYYSGPAGGGGTIYSSSTTVNRGTGLSLGDGGLNISIGGRRSTTNSTTTVTTTAPR